jgi:hypothetical protein
MRGLITLPLTVSYLIIGMGLLVIFNMAGVPKNLLAACIGHVVINLPLCFAIIYSQMGDHQINIERAARDLGATEWQVLGLVTLPIMWPAIFASLFLAMTFSWDEFVISFLLTRFATFPLKSGTAARAQSQDQCRGLPVFAVSVVAPSSLNSSPPETRMTALVEMKTSHTILARRCCTMSRSPHPAARSSWVLGLEQNHPALNPRRLPRPRKGSVLIKGRIAPPAPPGAPPPRCFRTTHCFPT